MSGKKKATIDTLPVRLRQLLLALTLLWSAGMRPAAEAIASEAQEYVINAAFTRTGEMSNFVRADKKIRFDINLDAAQYAGLQISSKLLKLAAIIR